MTGITSGLELTAEEAYSLLVLCLTSPQKLDSTSEQAVRKLASFCKARIETSTHISSNCELDEAG